MSLSPRTPSGRIPLGFGDVSCSAHGATSAVGVSEMSDLFLREAQPSPLMLPRTSDSLTRPPSLPNLLELSRAADEITASGAMPSQSARMPPPPHCSPSSSIAVPLTARPRFDTADQLIELKAAVNGRGVNGSKLHDEESRASYPTGMGMRPYPGRPPSVPDSFRPPSVPELAANDYFSETEVLLSIPISVRSRFSRKFRTLSVGADMLTFGRQIIPFAKIEWASCYGETELLIKASNHPRTHALIFASTEQRELVTARLAEWNVQQPPANVLESQQGMWSSGSSDASSFRNGSNHGPPGLRESLQTHNGNAEPWYANNGVHANGGSWHNGSNFSSCSDERSGHSGAVWQNGYQNGSTSGVSRHVSKETDNGWSSQDDGAGAIEEGNGGGDGPCCANIRADGVCVCRLCGCCQFKFRSGGGAGLLAKVESAFFALHGVIRRRSLEIGIFGLLMPLALAVPLHMWSYKKQTPFNRPWLPAECKILNFEEQSHRLYMHGDYLRNSHPNDGIYYVLQPAWRTAITPHKIDSYNYRDRVACCRQSHAQAHLPASIENVERFPQEPWSALAFDEITPGDAKGCKGHIAVSLAETRDLCHRDMHWTLPNQVLINATYPCWYAAHGATHVYLNVEAPKIEVRASASLHTTLVSTLCLTSPNPRSLQIASAELIAIILVLISIASTGALVTAHPQILPRLLGCCYRDPRRRQAVAAKLLEGPSQAPAHLRDPTHVMML